MKNINIMRNIDNQRFGLNVLEPDTCPLYWKWIDPLAVEGILNMRDLHNDESLQVVYRCPKQDCEKYFISYYTSSDWSSSNFRLVYSKPLNKITRTFDEFILNTSQNFVKIYNEAFIAEQDGLLEICWVWYRKALEFLIKDYLISEKPDDAENIKKLLLWECIKTYITDTNIKNIAKRAVWLWNDETHYTKKWENKDLSDLKKLIDVTIYWMESANITKSIVDDMPE